MHADARPHSDQNLKPAFHIQQCLAMAVALVWAVYGLIITLSPLQQFNSQDTFVDFSSSSSPYFAFGSQFCEPDDQQNDGIIDDQAQAELVVENCESAEMKHPVAVVSYDGSARRPRRTLYSGTLKTLVASATRSGSLLGFLGLYLVDKKRLEPCRITRSRISSVVTNPFRPIWPYRTSLVATRDLSDDALLKSVD